MPDDKVTIYKRGEIENKIDPKVLQIIALDDISVTLREVSQHLKKAEFKAKVEFKGKVESIICDRLKEYEKCRIPEIVNRINELKKEKEKVGNCRK